MVGWRWFVHVVVRRVPPHFSILPESTEVASGGAVNLTCVAVGSPMPHVKWRLGAVELTPENAVPIGKNVLQLSDVRETATYTCVAASDLGNIEYDAEVRVKGTSPWLSCYFRDHIVSNSPNFKFDRLYPNHYSVTSCNWSIQNNTVVWCDVEILLEANDNGP